MLRSKLSSLREYLTPVKHNSNFATTGEISPDEFVTAGDYLVSKFPTWQWGSTPEKLRRTFLPDDKQYLVTRHVPSYQRAADSLGAKDSLEDEEELAEDGWVKTRRTHAEEKTDEAGKALGPEEKQESTGTDQLSNIGSASKEKTQGDSQEDNVEEISNIDDLIDENAEDQISEENDFEDLVGLSDGSNVRRYDLYITYSTSYRVPKMYLVGFSSSGIPLSPKQMFEDIAVDYRDKTSTIESLPVSYNTTSVSIHPCKHSSVMKVLMAHAASAKKTQLEKKRQAIVDKNPSESLKELNLGPDEDDDPYADPDASPIRVDHYLIIFLKFIASVTPGIEYDYTMDAL